SRLMRIADADSIPIRESDPFAAKAPAAASRRGVPFIDEIVPFANNPAAPPAAARLSQQKYHIWLRTRRDQPDPPRGYNNVGSASVKIPHDGHQRFSIIRWAAPRVPAKTGWHARCYGPSFS